MDVIAVLMFLSQCYGQSCHKSASDCCAFPSLVGFFVGEQPEVADEAMHPEQAPLGDHRGPTSCREESWPWTVESPAAVWTMRIVDSVEGARWKMDAREQRQAAAKLTAPSSVCGTPCTPCVDRAQTSQESCSQPDRTRRVPRPLQPNQRQCHLGTAWKPAAALINSPGLPTGTHMCLHSEVLDGLTR